MYSAILKPDLVSLHFTKEMGNRCSETCGNLYANTVFKTKTSGISMPFVLFFPQFLHTVPTCVQFLEKAHLAGPYITFYFCQTVLSSMF